MIKPQMTIVDVLVDKEAGGCDLFEPNRSKRFPASKRRLAYFGGGLRCVNPHCNGSEA